MSVKTEATIEDLVRVTERAELVDGEIVIMSPTGFVPGYAAGEIYASLREYARRTRNGYAIGDNVGFVVDLPRRKSFSPDAAYYTGKPTGMKFIQGAPIFAVEVRSEGDYGERAEREIALKRADYFAAGTLVYWDVDMQGNEVVRKFTADDPIHPEVFGRGEDANAEPAVPDWTLRVDDLFPYSNK